MALGCLNASAVVVRQSPLRSVGKRLDVSGNVDESQEKLEVIDGLFEGGVGARPKTSHEQLSSLIIVPGGGDTG